MLFGSLEYFVIVKFLSANDLYDSVNLFVINIKFIVHVWGVYSNMRFDKCINRRIWNKIIKSFF